MNTATDTKSDPDLALIATLCLRAGMLMEDACHAAVRTLPADRNRLQEHVSRLRKTTQDIATLTAAAEVLVRRIDQR